MKPARLFILIVLLLTACSESGGAGVFVDSRLPPNLPPRFWAPAGWTWGVIDVEGDPALRYGVAAPRGETAADIVILTGYGETAEGWFETVGELVDAGFAVWVLESAGQGGSGRYRRPRDLGHAPDFDADVRGLVALTSGVVRSGARPVILLGSGSAAPVALSAAASGVNADRLILSDPLRPDEVDELGDGGWTRSDELEGLADRLRAQTAWMLANPDLRMGGPSRAWRRNYQRLAASPPSPPGDVSVTVISPEGGCAGVAGCEARAIPTAAPYQLAGDVERTAWLSAIVGIARSDHDM